MSSSRGVLLIGPRGAGKSSVGRVLAERTGLPFVDSDAEVERRAGASIAELMTRGVFRDHESVVLAELLGGPPVVLAAGGGAVLWDGLATAAQGWRVIWLDAATDVLAARIRAGEARPSLTGRDPAEEIGDIVRERAELYRALAWKRVATDGDDSETTAGRIHEFLRSEP